MRCVPAGARSSSGSSPRSVRSGSVVRCAASDILTLTCPIFIVGVSLRARRRALVMSGRAYCVHVPNCVCDRSSCPVSCSQLLSSELSWRGEPPQSCPVGVRCYGWPDQMGTPLLEPGLRAAAAYATVLLHGPILISTVLRKCLRQECDT